MGRLNDEEISKYLDQEEVSPDSQDFQSLKWLKRGLLPAAVLGGFLTLMASHGDKLRSWSSDVADKAFALVDSDDADSGPFGRRNRYDSSSAFGRSGGSQGTPQPVNGNKSSVVSGNADAASEHYGARNDDLSQHSVNNDSIEAKYDLKSSKKSINSRNSETSALHGDDFASKDVEKSPNNTDLELLLQQFRQLEDDLLKEMNSKTRPQGEFRSLTAYQRLSPAVHSLVESAQLMDTASYQLDFETRKQLYAPVYKVDGKLSDTDLQKFNDLVAHIRHISAYFGILLNEADKRAASEALQSTVKQTLTPFAPDKQQELQVLQKDILDLIHGDWFSALRLKLNELKKSVKRVPADYLKAAQTLLGHSAEWKSLDKSALESALLDLCSVLKTPSSDSAERSLQAQLSFDLFRKGSAVLVGTFGRKLGVIPTDHSKILDDAALKRVLETLDQHWTVYRVDRTAQGLLSRLKGYEGKPFEERKSSLLSGFQALPGMPKGFLAFELELIKDHPKFLDISRDFSTYLSELETSNTLKPDELAKVQALRNQLFQGFR